MDQIIDNKTKTEVLKRNWENSMLSIVIPCYNDDLYIGQAVNSALAQTWPSKEIIVVDDGSNEQTRMKLKSLANKYDILVSQENKGPGAARNAGIRVAKGEYILVLDSDDFFEPQFSHKAISLFEKDEAVSIVTCFTDWFSSQEGSKIFEPRGGSIKDALINNVAMGSSMFKKRDWENVSGYDENMLKGYEDWEFYIRLLKGGGKVEVIPEVLFNYRNKNNSRNKKANLEKYELLEYIYLKHSELYKDNFELYTKHLLTLLENLERKKIKNSHPALGRIKKLFMNLLRR